MRRARFTLEEQVGGLVDDERYDVRRRASHAEPSSSPRPAPAKRPLSIRAARVDASEASNAA